VTDDMRARVASLRQRRAQQPRSGDAPTRRLSSLIKISQTLAGPVTLDELVELVAREVCAHLAADQVFLLLKDARGELHVRAEYPRSGASRRNDIVSRSVCDRAMEGEALLIPEAMDHPDFQSQESVVQLSLRSVLVAPITPVGGGAPTGLLYTCTYYPDGQVFDQEDLELLKALASQVSVHLDRAHVLAEKDRLLRELEAVAASRGRVVEVASHELGTPMQAAWLSLYVAQKHAGRIASSAKEGTVVDCQETEELVAALHRAVDAMHGVRARFIEPLRAYYELELLIDRLTPAVVEQKDLDLMLAKWRTIAARHRLVTFSRLPVSIRVDVELFERAVTNLVTNAVNYSPSGSLITVEATRMGDELVIGVQDEGVGIPERDLPHVSTWLYRGENVANVANYPPGLGMGLYAARRIIEAHGGRLEIKSELGKGTRASLILSAFAETPSN
jgi:signal transduction histidine kinase